MKFSLVSQRNCCAGIGILIAATILIKASIDSHPTENTARFELTKPTTQMGQDVQTDFTPVSNDIHHTPEAIHKKASRKKTS